MSFLPEFAKQIVDEILKLNLPVSFLLFIPFYFWFQDVKQDLFIWFLNLAASHRWI